MGEWKKCQLGELITFHRGYDLPKPQMQGGKYPVIGSNGIIGYHSEYTTEAPSITIGRSGNVGKPFIYKGRTWSHNTSLYIKEYKNVDPMFIFYFLQTLDLGNYAGGSAVPTLNRNHIHTLNVAIPANVDVQRKISAVLSTIDDKIELNTAINENLEQQAQAFFIETFVTNASTDWKKGTIADLGTVVGGGTPSKKVAEYYTNSGVAWITPKDLSNDKSKFIAHGETDITEIGLAKSSATLMPEGTVLFSSRAPIGYIAIADGQVSTNQGFKSVVPFDNVGTAYIYYFLKENLSAIENIASGSTFKEVSGSTMKSVVAIIPDNETLADFQHFCTPIFEEQKALERENRYLVVLRDTLLPKLMNGEIDVSKVRI